MDRKEIVPTVNGVRGVKGQEVGFRVSTYYDIPLIPVAAMPSTGNNSSQISDMLFLDTDHLWLSVMKPTQYFEDGISNGNPFGVGQTVTSGIVSALSRAAEGISDFSFFIQTDAAINPGNSGGALVSMDGRLVGINTAIYSRSGGSQGIGFAIPSNMVDRVIGSALEGTKILSPWLGASGQQITSRVALNLGLKRPVGIIINNIYPGGPADRAGMVLGDVVVSVNQKEVETPAALRFRIAVVKPGGDLNLKVWRNGRFIELKLPVEIAPEKPPRNITRLRGAHPLSGAVIANMSPALAEELSIDTLTQGVIILQVGERSRAKMLGLRPGDYLIKVNNKRIDRVLTAKKLFQKTVNQWAISIRRGGEVLSLVVRK